MRNSQELSQIFSNPEQDVIINVTLDGTEFTIILEQNAVRLFPEDKRKQTNNYFSATVDSEGYFECEVVSKRDGLGRKLPGFYAKEITVLAFQYLSQRNNVQGFKGVWRRKVSESDNFRQFNENKLKKHLPIE